jgi:hypothetical protein
MPLDNTNPDPRSPTHAANWCTHEDDDGTVYLQIELGNDYAVLLACRPDEPPHVTLWHGSGEHDFTARLGPGKTPDSFRQWIEEAQR